MSLYSSLVSHPLVSGFRTDSYVPTDPHHDPSIAVIPICRPWDWIPWLAQNFGDHIADIFQAFGTLNPIAILWAIPFYAWNDALFHIPATIAKLGGCLPW